MAGEFDFIRWVLEQTAAARADRERPSFIVVPPGDDLAALDLSVGTAELQRGEGRTARDLLLVGIDQVLEGRHFDRAVHAPELIGRKAMNRNLSDCAAMGCLPAAAVVSVALPIGWGLDNAQRLYRGLREAANRHYCAVVGGDTGSWHGPLAVSVAVLGRTLGVEPVTRGGAAPGDGIYVTGPLGGSLLGRHLTFEPRIALGRQLATYRPTGLPCVHAMIDISDGLLRDLGHLLAPSPAHGPLGAELQSAAVPIHDDARTLAARTGRTPLAHALTDGEDHELLFTCPVRPPVGVRIGTVVREEGIRIDGVPASHFPALADRPGGNGRPAPFNGEPSTGWEHPL